MKLVIPSSERGPSGLAGCPAPAARRGAEPPACTA